MNVPIIFFVVSISSKTFCTPLKHKNTEKAKVSSVFLMSRRTLAYEKINKPNFFDRRLLLDLHISEFLRSIALKICRMVADYGSISWSFCWRITHHRDVLSYVSWNYRKAILVSIFSLTSVLS